MRNSYRVVPSSRRTLVIPIANWASMEPLNSRWRPILRKSDRLSICPERIKHWLVHRSSVTRSHCTGKVKGERIMDDVKQSFLRCAFHFTSTSTSFAEAVWVHSWHILWICCGPPMISALSFPDKSGSSSLVPEGGKAGLAWAWNPNQGPGIGCTRQLLHPPTVVNSPYRQGTRLKLLLRYPVDMQ